jgi:WD40 repeat protein/MinD-like ATPase involved in chromosome partitioning or flagellar assembly
MENEPLSGSVVTFYSYKGGVGRSMALANVATLLAGLGKKVLAVDWDLEAPGLEAYFGPLVSGSRIKTEGVVDLLSAVAAGTRLPWANSLLRVRPPGGGPEIDILGAGRDDADYGKKLRALDWARLFEEQRLGNYLEDLRREWAEKYDFVLVDSRTGITDIGGICTIHLPDVVVALFTANEQSIQGILRTMREARRERRELPFDRAALPLRVVPVLSRDETSEKKLSDEWQARAARVLAELFDWLPPEKAQPVQALNVFKLPYVPYWSFGERLPVAEEDRTNPRSISFAYQLLSQLIESDLDWDAALQGTATTAAATAKAEAATAKAEAATAQAEAATAKAAEAEKRTRKLKYWLAALGALVVLAATGVGVGIHRHLSERANVAVVASAGASNDPLEAALLLATLRGQKPPAGALDMAAMVARRPIPAAVLRGHTDGLVIARFSPNGQRVVTASLDKTARVFPVDGEGDPLVLSGHTDRLLDAKFSPDGKFVATSSADRTVRVWSTTDGSLLETRLLDGEEPNFLSYSPDGRLAAGTEQGTVFVWSASSGSPTRFHLRGGQMAVFNKDGLVTVSRQTSVGSLRRGPDLAKGPVQPFIIPKDLNDAPRLQGVFSRDGGALASLYPSGEVAVWNTLDPEAPPRRFKTALREPVLDVAARQVVGLLGKSGETLTVERYPVPELPDSKPARSAAPEAAEHAVAGVSLGSLNGAVWTDLEVSFDGSLVAVGLADGSAAVYRMAGATSPPLTLRGHSGPVARLTFSPNGLVVTASADHTARVWRTTAPPELLEEMGWDAITGYLQQATSACLSPAQRVQFLSQPPAEAADAFARCEREHHRTPSLPTAAKEK